MTWSFVVTTTAVGTLIFLSHGRELCRPSEATAWPMAKGLVLFHWASAHCPVSVGGTWKSASSSSRYGTRNTQSEQQIQAAHAEFHALVEGHLRRGAAEVTGRRGQDEPADLAGVLPPCALRDDPAHRVSGDDRLVQFQGRDHGGDVIGTVGDGEARPT